MDKMYWCCEYIKVFVGYVTLLYIWPNIMFRRYLARKGLTFRFVFCTTVQIVIINDVVLGLGLLHILNVWIVRGLFYGTLIIYFGISLNKAKKKSVIARSLPKVHLLARGYGWKTFWVHLWEKPICKCKKFWQEYKCKRIEYLLLIVILIFGMIYFSYSALLDHSYGSYDQYTHTRWIFALRQGNAFSEGIYPEAMHCFIYGMNSLFGIKVYSCVQFLAGIYSLTFLLAAYCLLKELFSCQYTPLFVLTLFLTFEGGIVGEARSAMLLSMARMTWTLPQEFGWYLVFLCPLILLRFFREKRESKAMGYWIENENLFLLMAGVGASFAIHFYVAVLAFFISSAVLIVYLVKLFDRKKILPLIYAVWSGIFIGSMPIIIAFIMGGKVEGSIWWGIGTFNGKGGAAAELITEQNVSVYTGNFINGIYEKGYVAIFGRNTALGLVVISLLILICFYINCLFLQYRKNRRNGSILSMEMSTGYLFVVLASMISVFLYAAPFMGLPEFISIDRFFCIIKILVYAVPLVPVDFFFSLVLSGLEEKIMGGVALFVCVTIYYFAYQVDFHEYLFWVLKRYDKAVSVTKEITEKFRQDSYMVISMGDEFCQVEEQEKYEQLLDFLQNIEESKKYNLPAEYIFLYVEKCPLRQGQIRYFTGPSWLGKKSSEYKGDEGQSWYPDYPDIYLQISQEMSKWPIYNYSELKESYFDSYFNQEIRTILCSKAYYWYQEFSMMYPTETSIYYEDENIVCYMIHQDPNFPLNLVLTK